jgi:prepilin-type N-terminal cleavage/methylation domain-containing protein
MKADGFSLLEIIVVVGLVSVVSLAGIASYSRFREKQELTQAAEDLVVYLQSLQKTATASLVPATCGGSFTKVVVESANATKFKITYLPCGAGVIAYYTPGNGIKINHTGGADQPHIEFAVLTGFISRSGFPITLRNAGNTCTNVLNYVNGGGSITASTTTCP